MRRLSKLFILLILSLSFFACEGNTNGNSASTQIEFAEILPPEWEYIASHRLETCQSENDIEEWLVLFRFDTPNSAIRGIVYQIDKTHPPAIHPYMLDPPDRNYLCECQCTPTLENVLPNPGKDDEAPELIVRDRCGSVSPPTTRLTIFCWNEGIEEYEPLGQFWGNRIEVDYNEVAVTRLIPHHRAQLAMRYIYRPVGSNPATYYIQTGEDYLPVSEQETEFVFYERPEGVLTSPYPEKVVLAFYMDYTQNDILKYLREDRWRDSICADGGCGCNAPRNRIRRVGVTYLHCASERSAGRQPCGGERGPEEAAVDVEIICERKNGQREQAKSLRWQLICEDNQWKMASVAPRE